MNSRNLVLSALSALAILVLPGCGKKVEQVCSRMGIYADEAVAWSLRLNRSVPSFESLKTEQNFSMLREAYSRTSDPRFSFLSKELRSTAPRFDFIQEAVQLVQKDYCHRDLPFNRCIHAIRQLAFGASTENLRTCHLIKNYAAASCVETVVRAQINTIDSGDIKLCSNYVTRSQANCLAEIEAHLPLGVHGANILACDSIRSASEVDCVRLVTELQMTDIPAEEILACSKTPPTRASQAVSVEYPNF